MRQVAVRCGGGRQEKEMKAYLVGVCCKDSGQEVLALW